MREKVVRSPNVDQRVRVREEEEEEEERAAVGKGGKEG